MGPLGPSKKDVAFFFFPNVRETAHFFLHLLKSKTILAEIFAHTQCEAILDRCTDALRLASLGQTPAMENVSSWGLQSDNSISNGKRGLIVGIIRQHLTGEFA